MLNRRRRLTRRERKDAEIRIIFKELVDMLDKRLKELNLLKIDNRKLGNSSHIGVGNSLAESIDSKNYQTISSTGRRNIRSSTSQATGWYCARLGTYVDCRGAGRQAQSCGRGRGWRVL